MKYLYITILCFILFSCDKKEDKKETQKDFKMYEMSEMSLLMEQMYVDNERVKENIIKGIALGEYPSYIEKMHQAKMTDNKENDAFFKKQLAVFIEAQKELYNNPKNAKDSYNKAIQACISCHEVKCQGPIERIKKLELK